MTNLYLITNERENMSDRLITNIDEFNEQSEKEYDKNVSRLVYQKSKLQEEVRTMKRIIAEYTIKLDDIEEQLKWTELNVVCKIQGSDKDAERYKDLILNAVNGVE